MGREYAKMMTGRELLIDEVKKYRTLYDTRDERHKDVELRDSCWLEIAQRLGQSSEALKREWKILRDSYRQVVKKRKKCRKNGAPMKKWRFENRMSYLLPFMTDRATYQPIKMDLKAEETEDQSDGDQVKPLESVDLDKNDFWETPVASTSSTQHQVDALDLFFSSVCQSTKKLSKHQQNKVKREILDVVMRAEEDQDLETTNDHKVNVFANL